MVPRKPPSLQYEGFSGKATVFTRRDRLGILFDEAGRLGAPDAKPWLIKGWIMLDKLEYTSIDGERKEHVVTLYTLSTCGFCKKAMAFLNREGFSYKYIHVDKIPLDTKTEIKKRLKELYHEDVAFPFAVIDEEKTLVGFIEPDWKLTLGIKA